MIYKSTLASREYWCKFSVKLQQKSIVDSQGKVVPKRLVFEKLYKDNGDQVQLELVMSGIHQEYTLVPRKDFDDAILRQQRITELTRDELYDRAVKISRRFDVKENFDMVIRLMVEGMLHVLDHHKKIEDVIKKQVQ